MSFEDQDTCPTCLLCQDDITIPVQYHSSIKGCPCNIIVCLSCIRDALKLNDRDNSNIERFLKCPLCRINLNLTNIEICNYMKSASSIYIKDMNLARKLDHKYGPIKCPKDCGATLLRIDFDSHYPTCKNTKMTCRNDCGFHGTHLNAHKEKCPLEIIKCERCGFNTTRNFHNHICVTCRNCDAKYCIDYGIPPTHVCTTLICDLCNDEYTDRSTHKKRHCYFCMKDFCSRNIKTDVCYKQFFNAEEKLSQLEGEKASSREIKDAQNEMNIRKLHISYSIKMELEKISEKFKNELQTSLDYIENGYDPVSEQLIISSHKHELQKINMLYSKIDGQINEQQILVSDMKRELNKLLDKKTLLREDLAYTSRKLVVKNQEITANKFKRESDRQILRGKLSIQELLEMDTALSNFPFPIMEIDESKPLHANL